MKANFTLSFLLILTIGFIVGLTSCNVDDRPDCPEEDWEYIISEPFNEWDSVFPYNQLDKQLKFLYSNDQIDPETLTFNLQQFDTLEFQYFGNGRRRERCKAYFDPIKRLIYHSDNSDFKKKIEIKFEDDGIRFIAGNIEDDFDEKGPSVYAVFADFQYNGAFGNSQKSITSINGRTFHHVFKKAYIIDWTDNCDGDTLRFQYSSNYDFLEVNSTCNHETFGLIID